MSIAIGIGWMRLIVGPPSSSSLVEGIFSSIGQLVVYYVGSIIGLVAMVIFILIDVFYIKRRIEQRSKRNLIRIVMLIGAVVFVSINEYLLEMIL